MTNAIETHGLCYRAGKSFAIDDLSIAVPSGSIYGFLGPNGSGKTTTIRLLLGLLRPKSGSIAVLGGAMPGDSARVLARVGYVPERPHLYPTLTVEEALRYHSAFYPAWDWTWANELAASFLLQRERTIGSLSKGETGKLMALLALAQRPELLVLDEPTDGLDPVVRRDLLAAVLDYVSQHEATVFISSHLIHELERICDWVGVMDHGRLIAELPMQSFKNGMKRLRVSNAPRQLAPSPFVVVSREAVNGNGGHSESWIVRGWDDPMRGYFATSGATSGVTLRDVQDLDLEEGFVELLRTFRQPQV
jgi:ABC-2 type transport system ATP-binding protein